MKTLKVFLQKKDWNQWGSLLVAAVVVVAVVAAAVTVAVVVVVLVAVVVSWDWKIYGFVWQPTTDIIWTSGRQRERQQETFILVSEKKFKPKKKLSTVGFREEQFASEVFCCSLGNTLDHLKSKNGCGCCTAAEHMPRSGRNGFDSRRLLFFLTSFIPSFNLYLLLVVRSFKWSL